MIKSVRDVELAGKRVLVREDYNVPLADGAVRDDTRLRASLPTVSYLLEQGAAVILISHLGRPKGKVVPELALDPVAVSLSALLGREVRKLDDCVGPEVEEVCLALGPGEIVLLENSRFYSQEEENDPEFASQLADLDPQTFDAWNSTDRMSLWINAYNGLTLMAIVDDYPIQSSFLASLRFPKNSIRQISGVWDRLEFEIMGRPTTLDQIEHGILRQDFNDPRIHFALVCAALGCPPLRNEPYLGDRLDEQLDDQVRQFLEDSKKFRIDRSTNTVYLSKILDWYGEDFSSESGDPVYFRGHDLEEKAVLRFISEYLSPEERKYLKEADYRLRYLDYDWSLNER